MNDVLTTLPHSTEGSTSVSDSAALICLQQRIDRCHAAAAAALRLVCYTAHVPGRAMRAALDCICLFHGC